MFESRAPKVFGPKGEEVTGGWRDHNKEFNNFYYPSNIISATSKTIRWAGHVAHVARNA
jgi:hypothetical protein